MLSDHLPHDSAVPAVKPDLNHSPTILTDTGPSLPRERLLSECLCSVLNLLYHLQPVKNPSGSPDDPTCFVESFGKIMNVLFRSHCLQITWYIARRRATFTRGGVELIQQQMVASVREVALYRSVVTNLSSASSSVVACLFVACSCLVFFLEGRIRIDRPDGQMIRLVEWSSLVVVEVLDRVVEVGGESVSSMTALWMM